jgi:hypothetical protein
VCIDEAVSIMKAIWKIDRVLRHKKIEFYGKEPRSTCSTTSYYHPVSADFRRLYNTSTIRKEAARA